MNPWIGTLACLLSLSTAAQVRLTGRTLDEKQQPLPFANVLLLSATDSTLVKGATTDTTGTFELLAPGTGRHLLTFSMIGYQTHYEPVDLTGDALTIPPRSLQPQGQTLGEVQVTARKPLLEMQGDKLVFNVESSPVAGGLNAFELLEKVPGVTIKQSDQSISLQGRQGVLVMLDGRQTYLSPDQLANLLKTMRAEEIEAIEVIANPSARYDAAGGSGILNIRTKRAKLFGTQYTAVLGGGYSYYPQYGNFPKYNASVSVSRRKEKITLFGGLSFNRHSWLTAGTDQTTLLERGQVVETRSSDEFAEGFGYHANARAGAEYFVSKQTTLGVQVKGTRGRDEFDRFITQQIDRARTDGRIETQRYRDANSWNLTANANLKHVFPKTGTQPTPAELTADLDYVRVKDTYLSLFDNRFFDEENLVPTARTQNRIDRPTYTRIVSAKADYVRPMARQQKLEAGLKSSFVSNDVRFQSDFTANATESVFRYDEIIHATYLTWSGNLAKKTQFQLGLRGEYTDVRGRDRAERTLVRNRYANLFPSLSLTQKWKDKHQMALSYSRRIDRPTYDRFNPFALFFSPLEYTEGNPNLLPGFRNVGTLTYSFDNAYSLGLTYQDWQRYPFGVYDVDAELIPGQRLIRTSYENVPGGRMAWYGATGSAQVTPVKGWNLTGNVWWGLAQTRLRRNDAVLDGQQAQGGAYLSNNLTVSKTLTLEISGWYNSGSLQGFERSRAQGAVNVGVLQSMWSKKGNLKLSLDDPFNLARYRFVATTDTYRNRGLNRWDNRQVRLTLTYNFGNLNVKSGSDRRSAEEVNRLGNSQ
jgi:hypothetical protein